MIATVSLVLGGFAYLIQSSYRRARSEGGPGFQPEGKLRWTDEPPA